jgi:hypothetical protein
MGVTAFTGSRAVLVQLPSVVTTIAVMRLSAGPLQFGGECAADDETLETLNGR